MEMVYIVDNPNKNELNKIRSMLGQGKLVVYPTDTIYGIGAVSYTHLTLPTN